MIKSIINITKAELRYIKASFYNMRLFFKTQLVVPFMLPPKAENDNKCIINKFMKTKSYILHLQGTNESRSIAALV